MTLSQIDQYSRDAAPDAAERRGTAVVLGGSMAGLCAARALRDWFAAVVVLERDTLPEGPEIRDGAPQTGQPHAMLEAGRVTLEDFFPGFGDDVRDAGGLKLDMGSDVVWYDQGGFVEETESTLPALYASRPLFEHVVRERVRDLDGVELRSRCNFITYDHDDGRVTGVRFRDETGTEATLDADLVVDATGRSSRTPRWLDRNGYPTPPVEEVTVDVTYSTARIERPPEDTYGVLVAPEPDRPHGAAMLPVEDGRWEVVLQGIHGERAPADRETFREWADDLPVADVGRQVRTREWTSGIRRYPFPASVRKRYETLSRFPDGLVVTGDAVASFNPIYGQGMSVAALDALVLHQELSDGTTGLGPRVFDRITPVIDEAWQLAVGNDFTFEGTTGPKPFGTDLFNRYAARLLRRAQDNGALTEAFFRVFRLERSATSLLHPKVAWQVLRPEFDVGTGTPSEESDPRRETAVESNAD
ncbi:FAD-dependent oxidoreductase [Halobellus ruber]|uniref:FAD-dependent monooxygenase n=1 Tax=Halobellus ruber TaxID=2761102 RepID=A0A7J9SIW8_9EURY|nr:FAD-dependent monooxygenase [Halobellus ruber]MBB6646875.1 FAD-dependent monooxygenase [Halobellus ruber]